MLMTPSSMLAKMIFLRVDKKHPVRAADNEFAFLRDRALLHHLHQAVELLAGGIGGFKQAPHAGEGFFHARLGDGLQQVVDRVDLERLHGILVKRSGKNEEGQRGFLFEQFLDDSESVETRHLDIEKDQARAQLLHHADGFDAVAALSDDFDLGEALQQESQLIAGRLFVIHNQGRDLHTASVPSLTNKLPHGEHDCLQEIL